MLSLALLLSACGGPRYGAPVDSRVQPPSIKIGYHVVSKGETLYSIAWRYGLDYKQLARVNGISTRDYAIYPGQKLSLNTAGPTPRVASSRPSTASSSKSTSSSRTTSSKPKTTAPTTSSSSKPKTVTPPAASKPAPTPSKTTSTSTTSSHDKIDWQWPAKGKVIKGFSGATSTNKGIDIQAAEGDAVYAAASGKVVYAGSGLAGYGKLIIIKHNSSYLSAYAHNRKLLVGEGDQVARGKKIGEIGSNNGQAILHFEIRLNGKPVNPQSYLPR